MSSLAVIVFAVLGFFQSAAAYEAQAWQSSGHNTYTLPYPERNVEELMSRPNVGISFSGGGSRAFLSSIGYLAALTELGIMDKARYLVSVSGGSWANIVYSYYQNPNVSDATMLGPIVQPEDITFDGLNEIDENCVRKYTNSSYILQGPLFQDWVDAVEAIYLEPSGIAPTVPYSYNKTTVDTIKNRNPSLTDQPFYLVRGTEGDAEAEGIVQRPYPIISSTLVGPLDKVPAEPSNRNYTLIEYSPFSAGVGYSNNVTFCDVNSTTCSTYVIGGLLDPFAFDLGTASVDGLAPSEQSGYLEIPDSEIRCGLAVTGGSTSWAPGTTLAASDEPEIQLTIGMENYSAPSAAHPDEMLQVFAIADGGGVSNTNFISLLQRQVSTIFAFVSTDSGLQNSTHWNPSVDTLNTSDIDFTIPAWFGQLAIDLTTDNIVAYDLVNSQVFEASEWLPFVTSLQAAQAAGTGMVITMNHTTVHNAKYGIEAGFQVEVVWLMLGRATYWESLLSHDMYPRLVPEDDPSNQYNTIDVGDFRHFPGYSTALADQDIRQGNVLSDFTGWLVLNNQDQYLGALGRAEPTSAPSPSPTEAPTEVVSALPSEVPTEAPTDKHLHSSSPSEVPTEAPTDKHLHSSSPSEVPTEAPTDKHLHSSSPSEVPTEAPTDKHLHSSSPSEAPTEAPTDKQLHSSSPSEAPTEAPTKNINTTSHGSSNNDDDFIESTGGILTMVCIALVLIVLAVCGVFQCSRKGYFPGTPKPDPRDSDMPGRTIHDNLI